MLPILNVQAFSVYRWQLWYNGATETHRLGGLRMSLFDEEELNLYNREKLQKMQKELAVLRQNADSSEIKKPVINNGYPVCPCEVDCNR